MSILETRRVAWPDEAACAATAAKLATHPALAGAFIELHGPLGAGKTTFVRHLLHSLGEVFAEPGLKLVEWPEKAAALLPPCDLRVSIAPDEHSDRREACFEAMSVTGRELLP